MIRRIDGEHDREVAKFSVYNTSTVADDYADYLNRKHEEDAL